MQKNNTVISLEDEKIPTGLAESQDDDVINAGDEFADEAESDLEEIDEEVSVSESPPQEEDTEKLTKIIKKSEKAMKHYQFFLLYLVLFLLIIWIMFFKIVGLTHMPNEDMFPRVDAGDLLLFYRLDNDVKMKDIVVLEKSTPDSNGREELYVARVMGLPGDTIEINKADRLVINGNAIKETDIFYSTPAHEEYVQFPLTLGEDEYFVLVDSREEGTDSRYFGPVKKSEMLGTVITVLRKNNL